MSTAAQHLEAARSARLDSSARVIEELVEAWRLCREPWLADLIDRWVLATARERQPIGSVDSGFHHAWLERCAAQQTADLTHLFDSLARAPTTKWQERVEALRSWPPNPFIARRLATWALEHPFGRKGREALETAFDLLTHIEDSRVAQILERATADEMSLIDRVSRKNARTLQTLARAARLWGPSLHVPATLGEGLEPAPPTRRDCAALFASVYAEPDDLTVRQVLADALLEDGDARGEFISLQLERVRSGRTRVTQREKLLVSQYRVTWLGPLAPLFHEAVFDRGFLVGGSLKDWSDSLTGDAAWRLVEWLDVSRASSASSVVAVAPRLRSLKGAFVPTVLNVAASSPLSAMVELEGMIDLELYLSTLCSASAALPRLERLSLRQEWRSRARTGDVLRLFSSPFGSQLKALAVELPAVGTYDEGVAVHDLVGEVLSTGRGRFQFSAGAVFVDLDVAQRHAHLHFDAEAPRTFFLPALEAVELSGDELAVSAFRRRVDAKYVTLRGRTGK